MHYHSAAAEGIEAEIVIEYQRAVVYSLLPAVGRLEMDLGHQMYQKDSSRRKL